MKVKKLKKIAIVHDILYEYGGAETCLLGLLKIFPEADIYTFIYNKKNLGIINSFSMYSEKIKSSFFSNLFFINKLGKYVSILKLVSWIYFINLRLNNYDLIISSSHSYNSKIVNIVNSKKSYHIAYIHTPPRYLYGFSNETHEINNYFFSIFFYPLFFLIKKIDFWAAQNPNIVISNSQEVRNRIRMIYNRDALVINPPVMNSIISRNKNKLLESYSCQNSKSNQKKYFIAHSRLSRQKGVDLIVRTCTKYNLPLVVIGEGSEMKHLKSIAGKTIFFVGFVTKEAIDKLYKNAKALIFAAKQEDFGLVSVEAQLRGVPVIAYKSGGIKETVIPGKTGVFFSNFSIKSLKIAIDLFEKTKFDSSICKNNAKKYTFNEFKHKILKTIDQYVINGTYNKK